MLPAGVRREDLEKLKAETNKIDWQRLAVEEEEEEEDLLGPVAPSPGSGAGWGDGGAPSPHRTKPTCVCVLQCVDKNRSHS